MKYWLVLGLLAYSVTEVRSQKWPSDYWHEGRAVIEEGDTLKGKIKYDFQSDLVQIDLKTGFQSLTARKLLYFNILDATSGRYRQFYSLPYSATGQYKSKVFFELLTEGRITLLSRETLEYRSYNSSLYSYGTYNRLVLVNKYFLINENGDIETFSGKRSDLMLMVKNREDEVKRYIKENRLDVDDKNELVRIIAYYNSLFPKR